MSCYRFIQKFVFIIVLVSTTSIFAMDEVAPPEESTLQNYKGLLGQKPDKNKIYAGMVTGHFNSKSLEERNWNNKLIGLEYEGIFVGTFENSFYNRSWVLSFARDVYLSELSDSVDFAAGYHLGLMTGYEEGQAPLLIADTIQPLVGIYGQFVFYDRVGLELLLTNSLSASLFFAF